MAGGGGDEAAEVVIVGAGIAGLATALALRRAGVARGVVVLERHAELRATGAALTIFPNGWFALRALGVAHKLTSRYDAFETCVHLSRNKACVLSCCGYCSTQSCRCTQIHSDQP